MDELDAYSRTVSAVAAEITPRGAAVRIGRADATINLVAGTTLQRDIVSAVNDVVDKINRIVQAFDINPGDVTLFEQAARRYGVTIERRRPVLTLAQQASQEGDELYSRDPDRCCALRKVAPLDPQNEDLYFGLGAFHYMADVVPKKYRLLRVFARLFPKGDRQRGLQELNRALTNGRFVPTEAAWTLVQLHYVFEENFPETLRYAQWLRRRHPDNALFHLYEGRAYERMGRLGDANRVFVEIAGRHESGQTGYTDAVAEQALYVVSRVEMQRRMYPQALAHLESLERLMAHRPVSTEYRALGRLRRGMALDALGRRPEAVRCYRDVLAMPHDQARDWAKGYLKKPFQDPAQRAARPAGAAATARSPR